MGKNKKLEKGKEFAELLELHNKIKDLELQRKILQVKLFKNETNYLNLTKGHPITKDCDFYINGKSEKKNDDFDNGLRIFALDYPGQS